MKIKCLLADDEPPARELLASYINRLDDLELCGQCADSLGTFKYLQKNEVDLLFLDIQMPGMNGLELIKSLHNPPRIVLITAYREYAVEGFELDVLDYLVKPVSFERFLKTVSRYHHYSVNAHSHDTEPAKDTFENAYMFFKVNKEMIKIFLRDILYIESMKDYIKVVSTNGALVTKQSMNSVEAMLPENLFIRTHRSFIVSLPKIKSFTHEIIEIEKTEIPIGKLFRNSVMKMLH